MKRASGFGRALDVIARVADAEPGDVLLTREGSLYIGGKYLGGVAAFDFTPNLTQRTRDHVWWQLRIEATIFPDAKSDPEPAFLGRASWVWEPELKCHIPCCTLPLRSSGLPCGNGPLEGEQIMLGDCGEHVAH